MIDLTVSIMNVHGPRMARIKRTSASDGRPIEAKFRSAQKDILLSDTTESLVRAAWTEGDINSPKIGKLHAPQSVPIPDRSLAEWTALVAEAIETSPGYGNSPSGSLSPPPRRFGSIDNDDAPHDDSGLFSEGFPDEMMDMAEAEDAKQRKSVLDNIEAQVPAV